MTPEQERFIVDMARSPLIPTRFKVKIKKTFPELFNEGKS